MKWIVLILMLTGCNHFETNVECGFVRNSSGQNVRWYNLPLSVSISDNISENDRVAIIKAATTWGHFYFVDGDADVIVSNVYEWNGESREQARTTISWTGNKLIKAETKINKTHLERSDLESLMLHEFGHSLGLLHQNDTIMNPTLGSNEIRRELTQYETEALKCMYHFR